MWSLEIFVNRHYGEREAVLIDTFLTVEASQALADFINTSSKNLIAIFVTQGHGDYFLALPC